MIKKLKLDMYTSKVHSILFYPNGSDIPAIEGGEAGSQAN
jgi:hypothetical protein